VTHSREAKAEDAYRLGLLDYVISNRSTPSGEQAVMEKAFEIAGSIASPLKNACSRHRTFRQSIS